MLGSIIAGGIIGGAGIYGNTISANSAKAINEANLANQEKLYGEQINLANTAHQREVADLRLAGLNPILSASGSGSASPAAGSVDLQNPDAAFANLGDIANSAVGAFREGRLAGDKRQLLQAQTTNTVATADNTATSAALSKVELAERQKRLDWLNSHPAEFDMIMRKEQGLPAWQRGIQTIPDTIGENIGDFAGQSWDFLKDRIDDIKSRLHNIKDKLTTGSQGRYQTKEHKRKVDWEIRGEPTWMQRYRLKHAEDFIN